MDRNDITANFLPTTTNPPALWIRSSNLIDYKYALTFMETYVKIIATEQANELIWLLEHPPLYTAGTSAKNSDLLEPSKFPVYNTGRGGQYTYHGPGQRIIYLMLNLKKRRCDIRAYIATLEQWIINSLSEFGIVATRREDRVGVWVGDDVYDEKIAAIGIRLYKWVSLHGIAINFSPNLAHYKGIIACGQANHGITSFTKLGVKTTLKELDKTLQRNFNPLFGKIIDSKSLPTVS